MEENRPLRLSRDEYELLRALARSDDVIARTLLRATDDTVILSRDDAIELCDRLTTLLARSGFDEDYRPTPQGQLLEALIDRLCIW